MSEITSLWAGKCDWCNEISYKYTLRAEIARKLGMEVPEEFQTGVVYGRCPFHRLITVPPSLGKYKTEIIIDPEENVIILHWWTNAYRYQLFFNVRTKEIEFHKNHERKMFGTVNFNFQTLFHELLMFMGQKELETTVTMLKNIVKENLPEKFVEIIKTREQNAKPVEFQGKPAYYFVLRCEDEPVTKQVQGYFIIDGVKYYKQAQSVWKLQE